MEPKAALPLLGFRRRRSKGVCPAPQAVRQLCRNRASQRWSALLKQAKSRIGHKCGMRKRLGEVHWAKFVKYAEAEFKETFFEALTPTSGVLCCKGSLEGTPCPKAVRIDLKTISVAECADELLFGVEDHVLAKCSDRRIWRKQIVPRCGDVRGVEGQRADDFCHDVAGAHYKHALSVEDIQWPVEH